MKYDVRLQNVWKMCRITVRSCEFIFQRYTDSVPLKCAKIQCPISSLDSESNMVTFLQISSFSRKGANLKTGVSHFRLQLLFQNTCSAQILVIDYVKPKHCSDQIWIKLLTRKRSYRSTLKARSHYATLLWDWRHVWMRSSTVLWPWPIHCQTLK